MKTTKRYTARLMASVLAILMLFSLTTIGFTTASAAELEIAETGVTMTGGEVIYFIPNNDWKSADARFAVYFFGTDNAWVSMTKTEGEDDLYEATVPAGEWTNLIFCRMMPTTQENNWENKWNQSGDLTFDGENNCFTLADGMWDNATGTWSVYTPPVVEEPDEPTSFKFADYPDNFTSVYAYAYNGVYGDGEEAPFEFPGVEMTLTGETVADGGLVYSVTFDDSYDGVIFTGYVDGELRYEFDTEFVTDGCFWFGSDNWYDSLDDINRNFDPSTGDEPDPDEPVPDEPDPDEPLPEYTKIYFQNNWMWSDVSIYYWGSPTHDGEGWPGTGMNFEFNDGTYDYYSYFIPSDVEGFLINGIKNDGSGALDQTPDIHDGWYENICYYMMWNDGNDVGSFEYIPACDHAYNSNGVCMKCGELEEGVLAGIAGYSLSLGGNIGVNQFVAISDEVLADPDAKMIISVPDTGSSYDVEIPVDQFEYSDSYYKFTCEVAAKEMASEVKLTLITNGQEYTLGTYTVKQYCESIISGTFGSEQLKNVARTMLNYGAASQVHFGYNIANLANDSEFMTEEDKVIGTTDLSAYAPVFEGEAGEVKFYGATLSLKSETSLKFYFQIENPAAENMGINVNGLSGATLEPAGGDFYMFAITDIPAHMLGEAYTLKTDGLTITYSALSYAYLAQQSTDATLVNVANALCDYADAVSVFN